MSLNYVVSSKIYLYFMFFVKINRFEMQKKFLRAYIWNHPGSTWYYYDIYIVFTYFASFTGYEDDIFEGISDLHVQGSQFGGKMGI